MPFYPYDCTEPSCAHTWEHEAPITAEKETTCPACKRETARRLIGRTMTEFRGKGWFHTGGY